MIFEKNGFPSIFLLFAAKASSPLTHNQKTQNGWPQNQLGPLYKCAKTENV